MKESMKITLVFAGILALIALIGYAHYWRLGECRKVGYSWFYCVTVGH